MMKFRIKSAINSYIRMFLDSRQFIEVSTPIPAQPVGEIYLSNSSGPYLKQYVVGGLERVYAIGRQFRNEKSQYHEFTTCSFCQAGADYLDFMNLTEEMLSGLVKDLRGGGYGLDIDFTPPFRRMDMIDELEKMANLAIPTDLSSAKANKYLLDACLELNIKCLPPIATSTLLDKLLGHFVLETFTSPTFIINHPEIMSPEAKSHRSKAGRAERFELFINKLKICSGQTELNDPILQRQHFTDLRKDQHRQPGDDDEAMTLEEILCEALEYGLPPAAGGVLGIDRLVMLLTGSQNIEEVLLPPLRKPQDDPSN